MLLQMILASLLLEFFLKIILVEADNTTVSINIGGHECELVFYEADPHVVSFRKKLEIKNIS